MSIQTYYAKQIFDKTKFYEFRKSPIKDNLLNEKIYIYSAKGDKAIIGYFRVKEIIKGNTKEILEKTGYNKRNDKNEIIAYYGNNNPKCYALYLYDVHKFKNKLSIYDMRKVFPKVNMPQYIKYIYEDNPLYKLIINLK